MSHLFSGHNRLDPAIRPSRACRSICCPNSKFACKRKTPKVQMERKKVIQIKLIVTFHFHVCVFCLQGGADVWDVDLGAAGVRRWYSWIWSIHRHSGQLWEHYHGDGGSHLRPLWYVWVPYCMSEHDDALIGSNLRWVTQTGPKCSPWQRPLHHSAVRG